MAQSLGAPGVDLQTLVEVPTEQGPFGLVHVIRDANVRGVADISAEVRGVKADIGSTATGRALRRLAPVAGRNPGFFPGTYAVIGRSVRAHELAGTVQATAVGMFAGGGGFAIAPSTPASTSLVVGGLSRRPRVVDGEITVRDVLDLTVTVDHNVVDGAPATRFAADLRRRRERPGSRSDEVLERVRVGVDRLLEQSVEEHSARLRRSPVESEGEFVEVLGQVLAAESVMQGAGGPALEQRGHQVRSGHYRVEVIGGVAGCGLVDIAPLGQAAEHPRAVGANGGARGDDFAGEFDHVQTADLVGQFQADPARSASGVCERWKIVPAVTEVFLAHSAHIHKPLPVRQPPPQPHSGQLNPSGHRRLSRYSRQAASSGNQALNSW
jgi:hypothetical protein